MPGGLIVLGSIHTEMTALLEDRNAPHFNRITDEIELTHLDIASVLAILREHADTTPERLLFLWTLFDFVALNETDKVIRFGACKRSADKLAADVSTFDGHVGRFLDQFSAYRSWRIERASTAPSIPAEIRTHLESQGRFVQDLADLMQGL